MVNVVTFGSFFYLRSKNKYNHNSIDLNKTVKKKWQYQSWERLSLQDRITIAFMFFIFYFALLVKLAVF